MQIQPFTATLALLLFASIARAAERPNFIILMTDDQRSDAMSCAGNAILKTPHLDRLAREGMHFRNMFVTNSLCAPSRATLLTGQYSHANGVKDNQGKRIPGDRPILSDLLRDAGYEVAFCGKSHIGGLLRDRKWDYYVSYRGQGEYLDPLIIEGVDGKEERQAGYMDDIITDKAIDWLKQKREKPYCLFLWFKAPHRPWTRAPRHQELFRDVTIPKPDTFDERAKGSPGKSRAFHNADNKIGDFPDVASLDQFVKDYYAGVVAVDENVGRVLDALQGSGAEDRTAVLFTSDNGFFHGEWHAFDKRFMHEPSIRVPLLISYPKLVSAGSSCDRMALNIDIAPTVLDLAGVKVPAWMHGRSLLPLLKGESPPWRTDWLYEYFDFPAVHSVRKHRGVRTERYKLIHFYEDPEEFELYDLQQDPDERVNLYGVPGREELTRQLKGRIDELRRETGDLPATTLGDDAK